MNTISQLIANLFSPLARVSQSLATWIAGLGDHAPTWQTSLIATFLVSSAVLVLICVIWAAAAHTRFLSHRKSMRSELARSRAALMLRDAIVEGCGDAIVVMGVDMSVPLAFGGGSSAMQECLSGPDASGLAAALERLLETGVAFDLRVRATGCEVAVRGYPIGRRAVIFLRRYDTRQARDERAALDKMPMPVWIRDRDLGLVWANKAFLVATGKRTVEAAVEANLALHKTELELARTVREFGGPVEARRYAVIGDSRRALTFTLDVLPDGMIMGTALDVTDAAQAEAKLKLQADANAEVLDRLDIGVAIFGADRRLSHFNRAYVKLWDLPQEWLDARPSAEEVFDRLRELRKLPEQRDFVGWKQDRLSLFDNETSADEEYWHLPNGQSLKVNAQPDLLGGLTFLYADVSDQLRLESSYTSLIRVQRATLDTLEQGVAVFGPDGRLKLHNSAFADLWKFAHGDLATEPHLLALSALSERQFERDNTWNIISSAVSSPTPESYSKWGSIDRSDGLSISLSLVRLPDGATLVSFHDDTNFKRLDEILRIDERAAA